MEVEHTPVGDARVTDKLKRETADRDEDECLPTSTSCSFLSTEDSHLDKHLEVVFILRNILSISEKKLYQFLKKFGGQLHPEYWLQICSPCGGAVNLFYETLKEISDLKKKLSRISKQLKGHIYNTKEEGGAEEGFTCIWEEVRGEVLKDFQEIPIRVDVPKISSKVLQQDQDTQRFENSKIIRPSRTSQGSRSDRLSSDSELDEEVDYNEESASDFEPNSKFTSSACASTGSVFSRKVSPNFGPNQGDDAGDESTSDFKPDDDDDDDDSNSSTHSEDSEDEEYEPTKKSIIKMKRQPNFRHNQGEKRKLDLPPSAISDPSSRPLYTSFCKGHKKMFKCSLCSAERIMRKRMIAHLTLHEKGEGSNCSHCGWLVVSGYMSRHISRYHPEIEDKVGKPKKEKRVYSYNCSKCPARSNDKAFMDTHLPLHEPSNEEPCTSCELCGWLVRTDRMDSHLASRHHSRRIKNPKKIRKIPTGTPFYCDYCHLILPRKKYLQLHFRRNHADTEELVACIQPTCEEKFESKQLLKFHLAEAHPDIHIQEEVQEEEGDQICKYCKLQLNSKMDVDYHIAKKHKDMLITCTTCNVNLKSYCLYRKHMESKAHGASPMYSCELCGKTYHTDIALQGHRQQEHFAELGLEPIKCQECGLITSNNQQLRYHIKLVHNKVRKYWCEFCGQAFGDRKGLESHLRSFHKGPLGTPVLPSGKHFRLEKKSENGEESWLCDFCTGIFSNLMAVRTHLLNTHYEQLSHVCEGCGKKFCASMGLHKHRKSCAEVREKCGSEEPPLELKFACQYCPKRYISYAARYKHQRSFHKDRFSLKCQVCAKVFKSLSFLEKHRKDCQHGGHSHRNVTVTTDSTE